MMHLARHLLREMFSSALSGGGDTLKRALEEAAGDGLGLVVVLYQPKTKELAAFRVGLDKKTALSVLTRAEKEL